MTTFILRNRITTLYFDCACTRKGLSLSERSQSRPQWGIQQHAGNHSSRIWCVYVILLGIAQDPFPVCFWWVIVAYVGSCAHGQTLVRQVL
jgi:hypothetical protein